MSCISILDKTYLFFYVVPIGLQEFVQTLHKLQDFLVLEIGHHSS
jgi:hypothetical protein